MKANELRIGNYVLINWSNEYRRVDYLDIKDLAENIIVGGASGIPLTEEILLKSGFEAFEDGWYRLNVHEYGMGFTWNIYDKVFRDHGVEYKHIKYLHQLQNFHFSISGTEININL